MTLRTLTRRIAAAMLPVACAMALGACGEGDSAAPYPPDQRPQSGAGEQECGTVKVPAHEGREVVANGAACDVAREVVLGAAGKGRAPYEAAGFACRPTEAAGGDTRYGCSMGAARIDFLYGTD